MDTISLLLETFAPIASMRILDLGCGAGQLARALARHGARVTGIDPAEEAIETARRVAPEARFEVASAERLPFPDRQFDGAVFLNSLHHVPRAVMGGALNEAGRVTSAGGFVVVIEPLASGGFFEAFRLIDDETEVRGHAQDAVSAAPLFGLLKPVRSVTFTRSERFADFDRFLDRAVAAQPERRGIVTPIRGRLEAAFRQHSWVSPEGLRHLDQPLKADILEVMHPGF
jgi:ubiquinone/menaquinone biosynthesis C-methylase UbiE